MTNNEVLQDFIRRYSGTFVFVVFPDSSEENLFHVDNIEPNEDKLATLSLSSPDYGKIIINYGTAHTLKFKYPKSGVYQHGTDACLFRRVPQKQYKHGICTGNSMCAPTWQHYARNTGITLSHETLASAFEGKTFKFSEAVKMLASKKYRSVALKDNYSLMLSTTSSEGYILLFWDYPVAYVTAKGEVQKVLEPAFENSIKGLTNE